MRLYARYIESTRSEDIRSFLGEEIYDEGYGYDYGLLGDVAMFAITLELADVTTPAVEVPRVDPSNLYIFGSGERYAIWNELNASEMIRFCYDVTEAEKHTKRLPDADPV